MLRSLGVEAVEVRLPKHMEGLDGLIIPGGESTTILKLMKAYGFREAIPEAAAAGMAVWGTCAGMIAIANELTDPEPEPLRLMDIEVSRNWYGRQVDSFEQDILIKGIGDDPFHAVFIRAPAIRGHGGGVEALAELPDHTPVALRSGKLLATAFHPELTSDSRVHRLFVELSER